MDTPIISIIIPVYNAGAYLVQCIESVLNQTFRDLEIIAVNDGSTDNSASVLDALSAGDNRLKVFHTSNRGVSAARNFGLEKAKGDFIGFVDADDWVDPEMFDVLYKASLKEQSDWAICNVQIIHNNGTSQARLNISDCVLDVSRLKAPMLKSSMRFAYDYSNWNKLFSANLIRKNKVRFNENMCLWEDLLFNLMYLQFSNRVVIVNKCLYNYRRHDLSITEINSDRTIPQFNHLFTSFQAFALKHKSGEEWLTFEAEMARSCYYQLLQQIAVTQEKRSKTLLEFLMNYYKQLKSIDAQIFQFRDYTFLSLQGMKKTMLVNRSYLLFSLCAIVSFSWKKKQHRLS